jgi:squalene cyclase
LTLSMAERGLGAAVRFLIERQDADGTWRDYELPEVGASDAWTTSFVGVALARADWGPDSEAAVSRAREAVYALRRPGGWGYNGLTATDADSTAWAVRLLRAPDALPILTRYLDDEGRARTFLNPRYGRWAEPHPDVTPVVGLALLAARARGDLVGRVRSACLRSRLPDGTWCSFWWATDTYALARNLEFLMGCMPNVPEPVAKAARDRLAVGQRPETAFEAAQLLDIAHYLGLPKESLASDLLTRQLPDGSWPASPTLRQRAQAGEPEQPPFADDWRLVSTASALHALTEARE